MSHPNPVAMAIAMTLASVSEHLRDGQSAAGLTPEERLAREREHDRQRAQKAWWRADDAARGQCRTCEPRMKTVVIQIGNTDNKLTQSEWSRFVHAVNCNLADLRLDASVHFRGSPPGDAPWQNYCWVLTAESLNDLQGRLGRLAHAFHQESIALTVGDTEFVAASPE